LPDDEVKTVPDLPVDTSPPQSEGGRTGGRLMRLLGAVVVLGGAAAGAAFYVL
jgi:hypothetical protein